MYYLLTMSAINERFKAVRKKLELSQTDFGKKLGLKQGSVGDIERSKDNIGVSESVKRLLESEYNVNIKWLELGTGEMFRIKRIGQTIDSTTDKEYLISKINDLEKRIQEKDELLDFYRNQKK